MTTRITRLWPLLLPLLGLGLATAFDLWHLLSLEALASRREALAALVAGHPAGAMLGFVGLYALTVVLVLPLATLFTVAGGLLFGWAVGGVLSVVAATLGAVLLFLAARHAFGDVLRRRAGGMVGRMAAGFRRDAFSYLLVLRLTPIFPFFALNVAPAFLGVPLRTFALATLLGILPGTFVYAALGSGLDGALAAAAARGSAATLGDLVTPEARYALLGLAALALLGLALKLFVLRRAPAPGPALPGEARP